MPSEEPQKEQEEVPSEEIEVPEEEADMKINGTFQDLCVALYTLSLQDTKPLAPLNDLLQLLTPEKNHLVETLLKAGRCAFVFLLCFLAKCLQIQFCLQSILCRNSEICALS